MDKLDEDATWKNAKQAADLKVFLCRDCDAVHFVMVDEDGNVIAFVDAEVGFFKQMVADVNNQIAGKNLN